MQPTGATPTRTLRVPTRPPATADGRTLAPTPFDRPPARWPATAPPRCGSEPSRGCNQVSPQVGSRLPVFRAGVTATSALGGVQICRLLAAAVYEQVGPADVRRQR